jgi:hypothetical protein
MCERRVARRRGARAPKPRPKPKPSSADVAESDMKEGGGGRGSRIGRGGTGEEIRAERRRARSAGPSVRMCSVRACVTASFVCVCVCVRACVRSWCVRAAWGERGLLEKAVQFAFRCHQFAGGFDGRASQLFARSCELLQLRFDLTVRLES